LYLLAPTTVAVIVAPPTPPVVVPLKVIVSDAVAVLNTNAVVPEPRMAVPTIVSEAFATCTTKLPVTVV